METERKNENAYLLEMSGIDKQFPGVKALDNAQIYLKQGAVHALMGENGAGKSTLMKCLFGIYKKDSGVIKMEGRPVNFTSPRHALDNGVAMVHQELNQVLRRSVMENVWLGRFPTKAGFIDHKKMYDDTVKVFEDFEMEINPREIINNLSVSRRQMVEIAKAVSYNAKVLVLDEPTSSLTDEEVNHLFRIIKMLCGRGVGIIYISHRMDEILRISDEVTIMRDGRWIDTRESKDYTADEIIRLMVNREMKNRFPTKDNEVGEVLMECRGITGKYMPTCVDVSFELKKGEVLGVAGLVGARRTELLNTLFGTMKMKSGAIKVHGRPVRNANSVDSLRNGFALITEERRATGLFPEMNVLFNSTIANINSYLKYGLLNGSRMARDAGWVVDSIKVKTPGLKTRIKFLSGGNQQKVIIGRWLLLNPEILLLDEPTRGIDVGAKYEIYQLILDLAKQGKGIIMVSSEMPELLGICDRIIVMSNGRLSGILERGADFGDVEGEQEAIMRLAAQYV